MLVSPRKIWNVLLLTGVFVAGCQSPRREAVLFRHSLANDVATAAGQQADCCPCQYCPPLTDSDTSSIASHLAGPQPVDTYIAHALAENPDIQAARHMLVAANHRVPQARSLEDPMLAIDTQMPPTMPEFAIGVSQKFPWLGKLSARADVAALDTSIARAQLAAVELSVVEEVKRGYYELHYAEEAIRITSADRKLLRDLTQIAEARYRAGAVNQQDVLRAQLEVVSLDNDLIGLRQQLATAHARLVRLLSVPRQTRLETVADLPAEQIPRDAESLYERAIAARPELQGALAAVRRERRAVDVAALEYVPDTTLTFGWMDMPPEMENDPFTLGVMVNLPIYRARLSAGVREAEANAAAEARRYDSLRDQTVEQITDLFAQLESQQEMVRLFRDEIVPKADQTVRASSEAYRTGDVDFLQLVDNWRQQLRFQLALERQETQLRQTLAALERAVGGYAIWQTAADRTLPAANELLPQSGASLSQPID
jgi:outer membrane protein, heavy metal efflux system